MQRHSVSVADPELLPGKGAGCGQHLLRWGQPRHRQHNFVNQPGLTRFSTLVTGTAILAGGQLEVPGRQKRPLRIRAGNPLTLVRLGLQISPPADVGEMRCNGTGIRATAGDLYDHFRRLSDSPPDLFDLRRTEPRAPKRSRAAETGQLEKWRVAGRQAKRSPTHIETPSSEAPPVPNRLCAALQPQRPSGSAPTPGASRA